MGRSTDKERDYDYVLVKASRRNNEGKDITNDKLGSGGRRGEGSKLSTLYYDPELFEESDVAKRLLELEEEADCRSTMPQVDSTRQMIGDFLYYFEWGYNFLERHPEVGVRIRDGAVYFGRCVAGVYREAKTKLTFEKPHFPFGKASSTKSKEWVPIWKREIRATQIMQEQREAEILPEEKVTTTIEQVQAEVLNALVHYIELKKSLQRLSNTNCIELQKLGFDGLIAQLESVVQEYPALMDESIETQILRLNFDELERKRIKEILRILPSTQEEDNTPNPTLPKVLP